MTYIFRVGAFMHTKTLGYKCQNTIVTIILKIHNWIQIILKNNSFSPALLVGMQIDTTTMENRMDVPYKTKNRAMI